MGTAKNDAVAKGTTPTDAVAAAGSAEGGDRVVVVLRRDFEAEVARTDLCAHTVAVGDTLARNLRAVVEGSDIVEGRARDDCWWVVGDAPDMDTAEGQAHAGDSSAREEYGDAVEVESVDVQHSHQVEVGCE